MIFLNKNKIISAFSSLNVHCNEKQIQGANSRWYRKSLTAIFNIFLRLGI
jgi:hypothetical protein